MSHYSVGTPITYTYKCGTANNGAEKTLNVIIKLKEESSISITQDLNKVYDGKTVTDKLD